MVFVDYLRSVFFVRFDSFHRIESFVTAYKSFEKKSNSNSVNALRLYGRTEIFHKEGRLPAYSN